MIGMAMMTGIELAGSIGIGTMIGTATSSLIPATAGTATKVCCGIGAGMTALATERIVVREFEGYCDDVKTMIEDTKKIRQTRKQMREIEKKKAELELQKEFEEKMKEEANNLITTGKK